MRERFMEVHIPISPRDFFFNRVRYLANSLRSFGGDYTNSRIVAWIGDLSPPIDLLQVTPWAPEEGVEWRWISQDFFRAWNHTNSPFIATMMGRFNATFQSEYIVVADADILFCREPSELVSLLSGKLDVGGVMTHVPPFLNVAGGSHAEWWRRMFESFDLPPPILEFEHTGWADMFYEESARYSPAYFNSGMIIGTGEAMNRMASLALPALRAAHSVLDTFFLDQIAFTLMMYKAGVSKKLIPLRFNFPNQNSFEQRFKTEAESISILHFLRTDVVDRDTIFSSAANIAAFVQRNDLVGTNELLRSRVEGIHHMLTSDSGPGHSVLSPAGEGVSVSSERILSRIDRPAEPRKAVVVLGMHRSGTSPLSRLISFHGFSQPSDLMPPKKDNPNGFWESVGCQILNDRILSSLGAEWDDPGPFQLAGLSLQESRSEIGLYLADRWGEEARNVLQESFGDAPAIVLKDPRIGLLLPLWQRALEDAGYRPYYLLAYRNPLEVAGSLSVRDGMSLGHALRLWVQYNLEALIAGASMIGAAVAYEDVLKDPNAAVRPILAAVVPPIAALNEGDQATRTEFLSAAHRHHVATADELERSPMTEELGRSPMAEELVRKIWKLLRCWNWTVPPARISAVESLECEYEDMMRLAGAVRIAPDGIGR